MPATEINSSCGCLLYVRPSIFRESECGLSALNVHRRTEIFIVNNTCPSRQGRPENRTAYISWPNASRLLATENKTFTIRSHYRHKFLYQYIRKTKSTFIHFLCNWVYQEYPETAETFNWFNYTKDLKSYADLSTTCYRKNKTFYSCRETQCTCIEENILDFVLCPRSIFV